MDRYAPYHSRATSVNSQPTYLPNHFACDLLVYYEVNYGATVIGTQEQRTAQLNTLALLNDCSSGSRNLYENTHDVLPFSALISPSKCYMRLHPDRFFETWGGTLSNLCYIHDIFCDLCRCDLSALSCKKRKGAPKRTDLISIIKMNSRRRGSNARFRVIDDDVRPTPEFVTWLTSRAKKFPEYNYEFIDNVELSEPPNSAVAETCDSRVKNRNGPKPVVEKSYPGKLSDKELLAILCRADEYNSSMATLLNDLKNPRTHLPVHQTVRALRKRIDRMTSPAFRKKANSIVNVVESRR